MYYTRQYGPNGSVALYETVSVRVPGEKNPKQIKTCIGKEVDGEFIPNRFYIEREEKKRLAEELSSLKAQYQEQKAPESQDLEKPTGEQRKKAGAVYLFDQLCLREGFTADLQTVFGGDNAKRILSIAYYMIITGGAALDDFTYFDRSHEHPWGKNIPSSTSSVLLGSITESQVQEFLALQRPRNAGRGGSGFFSFDSTTISTWSQELSDAEVSRGKQDPHMKHVAIALCYNDRVGRCVSYRIYRANVPDVKTIRVFIEQMRSLGYQHKLIVADRGYCSWVNIYQLSAARFEVLMAMKANMREFKQMRSSWMGKFEDAAHYYAAHKAYGISELRTVTLKADGKEVALRVYLHLYLDPIRKVDHTTELLHDLSAALSTLNQRIEEKEIELQHLDKQPLYRKYKKLLQIIRTGNTRFHLEQNMQAIDERCACFGYFELLSTVKLTSEEALGIYRAKDGGEKVFKAVKTDLGFDRPHVASDKTLEGKVFVTMLAGMVVSMIRKGMTENKEVFTRKMTYNKVLHELECINRFQVSAGKLVWGEVSKRQQDIYEALKISVPFAELQVSAKVKNKRKPTQKKKG
jgi:transposase